MFAAGVMDALEVLRPLVAKLGDEPLGSDEAAEVVDLGIEVERLGAVIKLIAADRVGSERWQAAGFRSAAGWMAAKAGTPVGPAINAMETLRLLDDLPATAALSRRSFVAPANIGDRRCRVGVAAHRAAAPRRG